VKFFNFAKHVDANMSYFKTAVRSRTSPPIHSKTYIYRTNCPLSTKKYVKFIIKTKKR